MSVKSGKDKNFVKECKKIQKELMEFSERLRIQAESLDQQVEEEKESPHDPDVDDSKSSFKRNRKLKKHKDLELDGAVDCDDIEFQLSLSKKLTEDEYYEALSKFVFQQRQSIRSRYPSFKISEIAIVTFQCWKELNTQEQLSKLKNVLNSKRQFGALMPEQQTALDNFFQEIKKSKAHPFLKKCDLPEEEEKKESPIRVTSVLPSPELEEQLNKSLQVQEEKKTESDHEGDLQQQKVERKEEKEEKIQEETGNEDKKNEGENDSNSMSMSMNVAHEVLEPIEEVEEGSRMTLSQPAAAKKKNEHGG